MVLLYQNECQDVGYNLWFVPDRILLSREVTNIVGVSYSCIAVDT